MALRLLSVQSDGFVIAFELISLLLLVTLICSITIARKSKDNK
jgi:NADH-quinone oxidoreductase subunit J